jgi:integrase/recombinase XerD
LCEERGIELAEYAPPYTNVERYKNGLPDWLVEALEQFLRLRQANWRKSHKDASMMQAWAKYTHLCRWLFDNVDISELPDIQQRHVYAYMDAMLARGYATSSVNGFLYCFHEVLRFMQSRGTEVPQVLLAVRGLKVPERLPRFLTDEQVLKVRADLEKRVKEARTPAKIRDSLLDRAAFYLLWHGGLRLGELELLSITDLNLSKRKLVVRQGKGLKDRSVYLTEVAVCALEEYLAVRGPGKSDHAFLYRFKPLCKDLIRDRTKAAGKRTGVKVTPHMLRHTFGTQLVNAGCRITTIQALLGHQLHNPGHADHRFRRMPITDSGHADHRFRPCRSVRCPGSIHLPGTTLDNLIQMGHPLCEQTQGGNDVPKGIIHAKNRRNFATEIRGWAVAPGHSPELLGLAEHGQRIRDPC